MKTALAVLGIIAAGALLAPWIAPADPMQTNPAAALHLPSSEHLFGTDALGRDVFSRALFGGQRTLAITALATLITIVPGLSLGLMAGWSQGWLRQALSVGINALLAFPGLLLALVTLTLLGVGALPLALATGLTQIGAFARMTRAAVLAVRPALYIEAAQASGAGWWGVLWRHILPNILPTVLAFSGVVFSYNLLNSAALSFLGLGGEPGVPDWGVMLAEGRAAFRAAPWIGFAPGLAITATVMAVSRLMTAWTATGHA